MLFCGDCGKELKCKKNGAKIFSGNLDMVRNTDAFLCTNCDKMVLTGHGGWRKAPIQEINLKERYDISLSYEHYSAVEDRAVCADCRKTMDFMGDGILLLKDEHAHNYGKMWVCPHCDYVFIHRKHDSWPPPLTLDEKRDLEKKFAPNIVRIETGVIPFFETIREAEREEGKIYDRVVNKSAE